MGIIDAVYVDGVFRPVGSVKLPEGQLVRLVFTPVEPVDPVKAAEAIARAAAFRAELTAAGVRVVDTTEIIARGRGRDE